MTTEIVNFIYLSELVNRRVVSAADGSRLGRIVDLAAATGQVYPRITGIMTRVSGNGRTLYIPWSRVKRTAERKQIAVDYSPETANGGATAAENEILLKKTFLDRQIISISGNKVVRVNDLQLLIDHSQKDSPSLWLVHIDIGIKGLLRRLGWLRVLNAAFRWVFSRDMKDKFVSWKYVQATSTANVYGSLHLKIDSTRLAEIHPADLADILEGLGIDERLSLLESLEPSTAAAALQELPMKIRVQVGETLETAKLAAIMGSMQLDEAVDLFDELAPEVRTGLSTCLPAEKAAEIRELSKLSVYGVGSIMNTDFITVKAAQTAGESVEIVRRQMKGTELIYYLYVVDDADRLKGIVTLRHVLAAPPAALIADLMAENVVAVKVDTSIKRVAHLFFKYNFVALPVVDDEGAIRGIITIRDALEAVFPEMKEESAG